MEKSETKILKRLKHAHDKQKETITYIEAVYNKDKKSARDAVSTKMEPVSADERSSRIVRGPDASHLYPTL